MHRTRYIALPAVALGLLFTGCGSQPEPAAVSTKAPTVAEVASKMKVVTPTATATPTSTATSVPPSKRGPYYESNRASQKCLKLVVDRQRERCLDRVEERYHVKDIEKAEAQSTPEPQKRTIRECLTDEGFTVEVGADAPTFITVNGDDGLAVAMMQQMATAKDASESQAMIDDMEDDAKEQAGEDGWSADGAENLPSENVGRYVINYFYPEDGEQDAVHNCVENFTKGN